MAEPEYILHLEGPIDVPAGAPFQVQGWLVSPDYIHAVAAGTDSEQWLALAERPDVRQAYPQMASVVGFGGPAGAHAVTDECLHLTVHIGDKVLHVAKALSPIALPPEHLQVRQVGGVWAKAFYTSGWEMFDQIAEACREAGRSLEGAERILDFGCGCGRVLRNFRRIAGKGEVWGCDIDAEAIAWDRAHLAHIAKFDCNANFPPLAFPGEFFDVIYSVSVFTHLPEAMQLAWLAELRRVLRPGGLLVASLHGKRYWTADPGVKAEVEARGFAYRTGRVTDGLPEFYMTAFHAEGYVRQQWARFFDFVALKENYIHGVHDLAIMRRGV